MCCCTDGQLRACTECGQSDFDDSYLTTKMSVSAHSIDVLERAKQLKADGGLTCYSFILIYNTCINADTTQ